MKTTIKRLENMGLNEEQIKKVFGWDDELFIKRNKYPNNQFDVEDLPQKIDAVVKGYDTNDLKKVKLFDEIIEVNGLPSSDEESKYKIDMITEFPKLLKHIKISRINSEIGEKEDLKIKLMEQLAKIDTEIDFKKKEITMLNLDIKTTKPPVVAETVSEAKETVAPVVENGLLVLDDYGVRIVHTYQNGNIFLSVKRVLFALVKEGDCVLFQDKKYTVTKVTSEACTMYLQPFKETTKTDEPKEHKTLPESDFHIDNVSKTGLIIRISNRELFDEYKVLDEFNLAQEGKVSLYKVKGFDEKMKRIKLTFVEIIFENKSYEKEEKKRFKFW